VARHGQLGGTLATAGWEGRIILWDAATGQKRRDWQLPGIVGAIAFAPDGRHLAAVNANGTVYILRLSGIAPEATAGE
jgi:WD40 repeat protein